MQASYPVTRSPLGLTLMGSILLVTLVLGGISGYLIRGPLSQSAVTPISQRSFSDANSRPIWTSIAPDGQARYEQGGRPDRVYLDALSAGPISTMPPTVYVQGGRPPIVYATP